MPNSAVLIYNRETDPKHAVYPTVWSERVKRTSLSTWERRVVYGAPDGDAEEFTSSWIMKDISGGVGIEDGNESSDTGKISFGLIDLRSSSQVTLPPETALPANPSGASGSSIPLGDVVTSVTSDDARFYNCWGTHAWGWDEGTGTWKSTNNNLGKTPLGPGIQYGGWLWVACGSEGALALRQSNDANGTLNIQSVAGASLPVASFGVWDGNLYAITIGGEGVGNRLWKITPTKVEALTAGNPLTIGANGWEKEVLDIDGTDAVLNMSHTPIQLLPWYNREGKEVLWCVTNKGLFMWHFDGANWINAPITPAMHPDFGKAAVTWRSGEALHVISGGLGMTTFTTSFVEVPTAGPGPQIPAEYSGTFVDIKGERSTMYALVRGLPPVASLTMTDIASPGSEVAYLAVPSVSMWLAAWTGTAWCCLSEDRETTGVPTKLHVSTAKNSYRLWWGNTDGRPRTQVLPSDFYQPRAKLKLGRDPFAPMGYFDTMRYDAMMSGWDKIASHAFLNTDYAALDEKIEIWYRTDQDYNLNSPLDDPQYHLWKTVDRSGRNLLWFDDEDLNPRTGEPWREGVPFQWIQFRFKFFRGANQYVSPVWSSFSFHHIRVPQDAASYVVKIPFFEGPGRRGIRGRSGMEMAQTLRGFQRGNKMIHFQPNNFETLRGRIVGISEEAWVGGYEFSSVMVLNIVELGASTNAHQQTV